MSVVLVGMSYRCAPISLLEKAAVSPEDRGAVSAELLSEPFISEALIVSTCNRTEFYVVCDGFHPTVEHIVDVVARYSGCAVSELLPHLYVRYAEAAAEHMLRVAAGLDSMVVGEQQIIGQIRAAYAIASELGTVGRVLHELTHRALRTGKRVHSETAIDDEGPSMVSFAIEQALGHMQRTDLAGLHALVVGAGAMSSLAATHLGKLGASLTIANRTLERAQRVAQHAIEFGVPASATDLSDLTGEMARADIVVTATGALDPIIDTDMVREALSRSATHKLVICDLSLPRDVACIDLDGLTLFNIEALQKQRREELEAKVSPDAQHQGLPNEARLSVVSDDAAARARAIVAEELQQHLARERSQDVVPTVKALRAHANEILDAEVKRVDGRLTGLTDKQLEEVHRAMKRVVDKLMHSPTVQLKKMAGQTDVSYSAAVRMLFDLPAGTVSGLFAGDDEDIDTIAGTPGIQPGISAEQALPITLNQPTYAVPSALIENGKRTVRPVPPSGGTDPESGGAS